MAIPSDCYRWVHRVKKQISSAPIIVTHPKNQLVEAGSPFTLTVGVTGTTPLSMQWRKNGGTIAGQTSANYSVQAATPADSGDYDVVASNSFGATTSRVATVTVDFFGIRSYAGLTVRGAVGQHFRIESQSAVGGNNWQALSEITLAATNQIWIDYESPTNASRFYRAVLIP